MMQLPLTMGGAAAAQTIMQDIGSAVNEDSWKQVGTAWFAQAGSQLTGAFTARSVFTLDESVDTHVEALYPVALSTTADFAPDALRVALRPDGWFGWSLSMESDKGLVPTSRGMDDPRVAEISGLLLGPGTYVVLLSFAPQTGALSISIDQVQGGTPRSLCRKAVQIAATDQPLWLGAGLHTQDGSRAPELVSFETLGAEGCYVPVSTQFVVGTLSDEGLFLPHDAANFDEQIAVRLSEVGASVPGQFQLMLSDMDGRSIGSVNVEATALTRLPQELLPPGEVGLRLDYTDGGEVLMTANRVITIGRPRMSLDDIKVDSTSEELSGRLSIVAKAGIGDIDLAVDLSLYEEIWNPSLDKYDTVLYAERRIIDAAVGFDQTDERYVDFRFPLPQKPGVFRLRLQGKATAPRLPVSLADHERFFTTYLPGTPDSALKVAWLAEPVSSSEMLEDFWKRGRVRELFINGLPAHSDALRRWAVHGVNAVTGISPAIAHQYGLKTRSWFTMNSMNQQLGQERLEAMAAVNEDGSFRRPYDPLFPTVAMNWTACIENPLWIEHSREVFRNMARAGYDGAHIDYAGHYEPCFCKYCHTAWERWAAKFGLEGITLASAMHATDLRTQLLVREFRIQGVMAFLKDLREVAREIRPGFAIDGTWHQDSSSTYQWAYGDHFDLMCIEGTTWGPFPPEGTQVLWMKLAHALSERPDRRPPAMSVTYHLLHDKDGHMFHGRMAADRLRIALAEIISEGGVSWKGLGGPQTGSLLREHQDIVRAYYRLARDIEPLLVDAEDVAAIGIVFSPRSYLLTNAMRTQLYAIGQALMQAHVPFRVISDVGLETEALSDLSGVVLLSARALSDDACTALQQYIENGGQALVIGGDAATLTEDWQTRKSRPAFAVPPSTQGTLISRRMGKGECHYWTEETFSAKALGAVQSVALDHDRPTKLAVEGWSRAEDVVGQPDGNYSLYVDLIHADGSPLWGQTALFGTGTHDWQFSRQIIESNQPFRSARVHTLFRNRHGSVWFKDVRFGVWDEERQEIVENLLGNSFRDSQGNLHRAVGEKPGRDTWSPYRDGYVLRNMLDEGLWAEMSSVTGLAVGPMHRSLPQNVQTVLRALAPLLPAEPFVVLEGEGAECVSVNLTRAHGRIAVHLINHRAELHPDLSEAEQQAQDRTIPTGQLTLTLRVPKTDLHPMTLATHFPEETPEIAITPVEGGVQVHIGSLTHYGVLAFDTSQPEE
ncbi:MAG: alpha-amylase family protein [Limnochordia bacterium]